LFCRQQNTNAVHVANWNIDQLQDQFLAKTASSFQSVPCWLT